ncbi:hypothetical protein QBC38DRAFT_468456 [Podospora fimiseda]|uniref:DUF1275 domain protein n=1 Tax=Podospora fimiseda TaxID=252190 RepID=A0AAN7BW64_9PEZI|nr:hypothetical protein QBC38DRAFT_468456 [Podospora fimiseda]
MGNQDPPKSSATSMSGITINTPETNNDPPTAPTSPTLLQKTWTHLLQPIPPSLQVELLLLLLTFSIGLQDAISFYDFNCFASNQTGNTVLIIIAMVLPELNGQIFDTSHTAVALSFFLLSAYLTGQVANLFGFSPRNRLFLILCNLIQTGLVFAAAAVQYVYGVTPRGSIHTLFAIGLLATAAGSQVVQSRSFKMTEISTAMATAAWVDLVIDKDLFKKQNRARNRRIAFLATLALGTLAGAFIFKTVGSPAALAVSGAGKGLVTLLWCFASGEREKEEEKKNKEEGKEGV